MNGTLEDTTPAGVLQVLSSQGSTGAVRFLGSSGCTVYLHHGELYFAESTETAEDLAVALVRPGRLTAEQWDASTDAGYPTETVGEELIATGGITRELLASVVLSIIYDPLIQLFRAPEGDYEFAPDVVHWIGPYRSFSVDAIVSEVRRRTREADEMAPVVPSLDAVVRSARTLPETHGSVNLRRDDWEVVVGAAGGSTVRELAAELGRGSWSTARIVYRLATADLLMVTPDEPSATVVDDDADTTEPAFSAQDHLGTGFAADFGQESAADTRGFSEVTGTSDDADRLVIDPAPWGTVDAEPETTDGADADDPWGEFEAVADDDSGWDPSALYGGAGDESTDAEDTSSTLSAVPDPDGPESAGQVPDFGGGDEPLELHPDIAKALAESTYADSATAINAMAARLGAIDTDDDDDDWDTAAAGGTEGEELWSTGASGAEESDFIWKPAVWDTGVESMPLPQRESARATAPAEAGSDPAWLNNLYSEFMPGEDGAKPPEANAEDPDAAPKQRTLRRLMSAIRRL